MNDETKIVMGQPMTRAEFDEMKAMMAGPGSDMMGELDAMFGDSPSTEVRHSATPIPQPADEAEIRRTVSLATWGFKRSWGERDEVEIDLLFVPNAETLEAKIDWSDGVQSNAPPRFDAEKGVLSADIPSGSGDELTATVTVSVASELRQVSFGPDDEGNSEDGYELVSWAGRAIKVKCPPGSADPLLVALDGDGRRLAWDSTGSSATHRDGRQIWDLEWDEVVDEHLVQIREATFCGEIAKLRVLAPISRVDASTEIRVVEADQHEDAPTGVRLAQSQPMRFEEPSESDIRTAITVAFGREEAMMSSGQPKIVLQLPNIGNSAFARVEFSDFTLAGVAGFEPECGSLDYDTFRIDHRFEPHGDGLTRITGKATVRYPLRVDVHRIETSGAIADGRAQVAVNGCDVTIAYQPEAMPGLEADVAPFAPACFERIVGFHESGELLARLPYQGMSSSADGVERTSRFWGPVAKAEIRHPTDYVDIEVAIDLAVEEPTERPLST